MCVSHVSSKECTRDCNTRYTQISSWFEYQREGIIKEARQRRPPRGQKIGEIQINIFSFSFLGNSYNSNQA